MNPGVAAHIVLCHFSVRMPDSIAKSDSPGRILRRLRREAQHRPLVFALGLLALVSLVFLLAPNLDLTVSSLFYDPAAGFFEGRSAVLEIVRDAGRMIEWALAIAVSAPLPLKVLFPQSRLPVAPRATLFVLATFALGPGFIVNGILKEYWGRARPRQIVEFGGEATFSPVWWISDQCDRNCSFVSGEAASAFCLVSLVFLVPKSWKPTVAVATVAFAAAVSLTRIAAGGHFLSDVLLAWLLTLCIMIVLHRLILKGLPATFDHAVEAGATRTGEALRRLFRIRGRPPAA